MNTVVSSATIIRSWFLFALLLASADSRTQTILTDLRGTATQADYVIIVPSAYVTAMLPLAQHRASRNRFSVALAQTDSIYSQFGLGIPPDSAIRRFIHFALTSWTNPKPEYFLLAGNVNTVPSHKEEGLTYPPDPPLEDSIMVDDWFVEGLPDSVTYPRPAAAIGRLPGFGLSHIESIVAKTIAYETNADTTHRSRSISVADYFPQEGDVFEQLARRSQYWLSQVWRDTITVHIRQTSPFYRDRYQLRQLLSQGAALLHFIGHGNSYQFSHSRYFTTWDVDSLIPTTLLPLCTLTAGQRFEKPDTHAIVVSLLIAQSKGAIATIAPSGLIFSVGANYFTEPLFQAMTSNQNTTIGKTILTTKRLLAPDYFIRRFTFLGDPALVIKSSFITGVKPPRVIPENFTLHQNYPNPFNPETNISFDLPKSSFVTLKIFNGLGQEVATIVNEQLEAGTHTYKVSADGLRLPSAVYFYRISAGEFIQTRKMLLTK